MDTERTDADPAGPPPTKADLLAQIDQSRGALEQAIGQLSDAQLVAPGAYDGWSVKDHLAHLSAWEAGMVALLQRRPRWEAMGLDEQTIQDSETDDLNAIIQRHSKERPLAEVRAEFEQVHRELLDTLAGLTDADLLKPYSYYQPDEPGEDSGDPIVNWLAGNTFEHYAEHLPWIQALVEGR